jgi:DNA-binding NarL/FixJ family response regulator
VAPTGKLRLLLIDDNRLFREGLAGMLSTQHDLTVVAAVANGVEALRRLSDAKPDVVLLDQALRNGEASRLARTVRQASPNTKVIVMGLLPMQEDVVAYVQAGVSGFLMKAATLDDFLHAIRSVAQGANILPPTLTVPLFSQIADVAARQGDGRALDSVRLTKREREVVDLIAAGMSNKEIAHRLHVAMHTVRSHVHNVLEKLALRNRLQIAAYMHARSASRPSGDRPEAC